MMLAAELALAGVDVAIVERRTGQDLVGLRAGGLHSRTVEVFDQRGIAGRFLSQGQLHHMVLTFRHTRLETSVLPSRHNYYLSLWQNQIERTLAGWVAERAVPVYRGVEVTGFVQDRTELLVEAMGHQALGWEGEGYSPQEIAAMRSMLRAKGNSIEGGTSEVNLNVVSKRVLGLLDHQ